MTYFQILLAFIVPPIVMFLVFLWRKITRKDWALLMVLIVVAVTYTTPWDNYLVASEVWWYDLALVTGFTIGWVPIEEYTFFILQTLMTGLLYFFLRKNVEIRGDAHSQFGKRIRLMAFISTLVIWIGSVVILFSGWQPGLYLALILAWALVPISIQIIFGADLLLRNWVLILTAILPSTIYLGFVDWLAIGFGTWTISAEKTTGLLIAGRLPIEELLFFMVTNILVVYGLHLGLHPESIDRIPKNLQKKTRLLESK